MGLESADYIASLNEANPVGGDPRSEGDNHLRLIKGVLKATFPSLGDVANCVSFAPSSVDPQADSHKIYFITSDESGSFTLPALSAAARGFTLHFMLGEGATASFQPSGLDLFYNAVNPLELVEFDGVSFIHNDTNWVVLAHIYGVKTFNARSGDVTLSSSDVTTALGFTPADAADLATLQALVETLL